MHVKIFHKIVYILHLCKYTTRKDMLARGVGGDGGSSISGSYRCAVAAAIRTRERKKHRMYARMMVEMGGSTPLRIYEYKDYVCK